MSSPKVIVQIAIAGAQILGKAFAAAGRQALQNAKHRPEALGGDVGGVRGATSGSFTDKLSREHRMTLDEARLILNVRKEDGAERILQHYEHLFKANAPPAPPAKPSGSGTTHAHTHTHASRKGASPPAWSHYLQSKVVRARERIEAESKGVAEGVEGEAVGVEAKEGQAAQAEATQQPPPPEQNGGKAP